jgi:hypothetical protein
MGRYAAGGGVDESVYVSDPAILGDDHVKAEVGVGSVVGTGVPLEPGLVVMRVDGATEGERHAGEALLRLDDERFDLLGPAEVDMWVGVRGIARGAFSNSRRRAASLWLKAARYRSMISCIVSSWSWFEPGEGSGSEDGLSLLPR